MAPGDFGYDNIKPANIGSCRADRRKALAELEARLSALRDKADNLAGNLARIGVRVDKKIGVQSPK